jgi:hypothetical protein
VEERGFEPLVPCALNAPKAGERDDAVYFARMRDEDLANQGHTGIGQVEPVDCGLLKDRLR